jgi:hypothetical protein
VSWTIEKTVIKLKACPFCGEPGYVQGGPMLHMFGCANEGCKVRPRAHSQEAWETRTKAKR